VGAVAAAFVDLLEGVLEGTEDAEEAEEAEGIPGKPKQHL
jgi:hypothetical protein